MTDEFDRYHPLVNLIFYIVVIAITMCQMHAVMVLISFVGAIVYYFMQRGLEGIKYFLMILFVMLISAFINPLFSHKGMTLLFYSFTGNPITLESIIYGIASGLIVGTMLLWFATFNRIITSDKILAVVGRIAPSVAMMLSIVFRFVPKYIAQGKRTIEVNTALGAGDRLTLKEQLKCFSITTTWALENSVDTADSMSARGYGVGKRTNYNNYRIELRDIIALAYIVFAGAAILVQFALNNISYSFYPLIKIKGSYLVYIVYIGLCMMPVLIDIREEMRWRRFKSKI